MEPNREQPRKNFDEDSLVDLSESIKQVGVLQPLLVLDKKEISLSGTGSTQEVTASITPENGASYPELMWSYKAISGDAATDNDLEITYIESTHKVKVTLVNFIEGAQYRLTATTKDGTDLSASLVILANADPATSRGGNSGGFASGQAAADDGNRFMGHERLLFEKFPYILYIPNITIY